MGLKKFNFKDTYWSGEDTLIESFYIPCLKNSITYDRAVGFFNSSILNYISEGLFNFITNGGKIRLICSTRLSQNDINMIREGYAIKKVIASKLNNHIDQYLLDKDKPNVKNLCWLVKNNRLEIRVCIKTLPIILIDSDDVLFHEKFGIFKDEENNMVSFLGSINESSRGWMFNEESFEVSYSWEAVLKRRVLEKVDRFEKLWNGIASEVNTYDFPAALREKLIQASPDEPVDELSYSRTFLFSKDFKPRECQVKALQKFLNSKYNCMFEMATGSGKTKAALHSYTKVLEWSFLLILAPGSELVLQWEAEAKLFFPKVYIIKCGSNFGRWKEKLLDVIQAKIPERTIVISTYASAITNFALDKWSDVSYDHFGIIYDEAHNLGAKETQKLLNLNPKFRIGLSATPKRNFDEEGTEKILSYFNNETYEYLIKDAIKDNLLVEYEYHIYPCILEQTEWMRYIKISKEISKLKSYWNNEETRLDTNDEIIKKKYLERSEILKTASNKLKMFPSIINFLPARCRTLIYADSVEHLNTYATVLDDLRRDYFIYTGDKDSKIVRPKMLEEFRLGVRKILLAIECLDEGIDIPACDAAIFISSSTSERQFIQRRGRVLRKAMGKRRAYIYDFLVIPNYDQTNEYESTLAKQVVLKEYERINLIADDAINGIKTKNQIDEILLEYGFNIYNY